jgi:hypothetical protein
MEHNKDYMNTHTHGLGLLRVAYTGFKNLNMQPIHDIYLLSVKIIFY